MVVGPSSPPTVMFPNTNLPADKRTQRIRESAREIRIYLSGRLKGSSDRSRETEDINAPLVYILELCRDIATARIRDQRFRTYLGASGSGVGRRLSISMRF
jgi:hypothetical protein